MRGKIISIGLICCLGMSVLTGCEHKTINYGFNGSEEDGSHWKETIEAGYTNGDTVNLDIDADVSTPPAERMHVIEVEEVAFDEAFKKKIAERIFGSETVCYHDIDNLPRKELEELMEECQWFYDTYKDDGQQWSKEPVEECRVLLEQCEAALPEARDTYTPVETYSVNEYLGNRDGVSYELNFLEKELQKEEGYYDGFSGRFYERVISMVPQDITQVAPKEAIEKFADGFECYEGGYSRPDNLCQMSEEEAEREAQSFLEALDLEYAVFTGSSVLRWGYLSRWEEDGISDGYVFTYEFGMDELSFTGFGSELEYSNLSYKKKESDGIHASIEVRMQIYVNDHGVIQAEIQNPQKTIGVTENVELLPFGAIKGFIKEELIKDVGQFRFDLTQTGGINALKEMDLIYFRVRDKENEGRYSYVPTWRLSDTLNVTTENLVLKKHFSNPVLINAIDGSVISLYEEL